MLTIKPGEHGSTFGGNPLACAVGHRQPTGAARRKSWPRNAERLGKIFRSRMEALAKEVECITLVRGKGLLNAIGIAPRPDGRTAWDICLALRDRGLLAKPTREQHHPPGPAPGDGTDAQLEECCGIIEEAVKAY